MTKETILENYDFSLSAVRASVAGSLRTATAGYFIDSVVFKIIH